MKVFPISDCSFTWVQHFQKSYRYPRIEKQKTSIISKVNTKTFNLKTYRITVQAFHQHGAKIGSSRRMCSKKSVLENFTKFTGEPLCRRLFLITFQACTFIKKKRLQKRCFLFQLYGTPLNEYVCTTDNVGRFITPVLLQHYCIGIFVLFSWNAIK